MGEGEVSAMSEAVKVVLSLSVSGSLCILLLFLCRPILKNKLSKRWQYYIWLVVIARLLLPLTPEVSLTGFLFQRGEQAAVQLSYTAAPGGELSPAPSPSSAPVTGEFPPQQNSGTSPAAALVQTFRSAGLQSLGLIWLGVALGLLIRKITIYQNFVKYVKAGRTEVSSVELLDRLAELGTELGIRRPVELFVNRTVSSPLLIGFFRPCIVLPTADLSDEAFRCTVLHELTHYRRRDMFYKWLTQLTICLHWFNPLVWLMGREISRACELSCDEAVIRTLDAEERRAYGDTLLHAMDAEGTYQSSLASITLNESAKLLKERLYAIMRFQNRSKRMAVVSLLLAAALTTGAAATGAYPIRAKAGGVEFYPNRTKGTAGQALPVTGDAGGTPDTGTSSLSAQAEQYYAAGSLPLFKAFFPRLEQAEQEAWLERIYADQEIAFFSVAIDHLNMDDPLIGTFAEKAYADTDFGFFSVLTGHMSKETLESWLDQALQDGPAGIQSILFQALGDRDWEWEAQKAELERQLLAEYGAYGITKDGNDYYYQGQLVNVFLDQQRNHAFYTLDMNPNGTVNVKVIRSEEGAIERVAYMTQAELDELFGDDDWDDSEEISIPVDLAAVGGGETVWLGTYSLAQGDQVHYHLSAETGEHLQIGFAKLGEETSGTRYYCMSNSRIDGVLQVKASITWNPPVSAGEYRLFIQATSGSLTNVTGCVTIVKLS